MNGYLESAIMLFSLGFLVGLFYLLAKAIVKMTGNDDEQD
jgi:hypothetical protein